MDTPIRPLTRAEIVSPAKQGLACAPALIATTAAALARPLNDSARAIEITCPP